MKVLYLADAGTVGGAKQSLTEMIRTLSQKHGIECIACTSLNNEFNAELSDCGIVNLAAGYGNSMECPSINMIRSVARYGRGSLRYLMNSKAVHLIESKLDVRAFDLIHSNSARVDIGATLAKKYHVPHIMHIREFGKEDFNCVAFRPGYSRYLNENTDRFIAISRAVKDSWVKKKLPPDKIEVIYNGVDFRKIEAVPLPMQERKKLKMVIVGGIISAKGQYQAIEALGMLPEDIRSSCELDVVGWGDENHINILKRRTKELNIEDRVRFIGARSDVYTMLKNYDVGLMCSLSEGFGRVTVEYMHANLLAVASDSGANQELIQNGVNGLLYKSGDPGDLATKIENIFRNRAQAGLMARAGKDYAVAHFTNEINAQNIYNLYLRVLDERKHV